MEGKEKHFRQAVSNERSVIQTAYPVFFTSYVHHLSQDEILAEKIRAVMTRKKGRDLYDLWYLLAKGAQMDRDMLKKKLAFYDLSKIASADIVKRVASFPKKDFVLDLRPFVPLNERDRLPEFYEMVQAQIEKALLQGGR
jgi:predicted nucleotidyltransferase component of viral defense system